MGRSLAKTSISSEQVAVVVQPRGPVRRHYGPKLTHRNPKKAIMISGMPRESFRAFSSELETLAGSWAQNTFTVDAWKDGGFFASSESNPFQVSVGELSGIAKPGRKKTDNICRAAHEKIASDLAFELKLPIPPVILWDMGSTTAADRERYVAISAWAFPQPLPWGQVTTALTQQHTLEASQAMSAMQAFETWISAGDRRPDHVLTYLQAPDKPLQLAVIDYAYSMSQVWAAADDPSGLVATYLSVQPDIDSLKTMTERILQLADERVKTIVNRITGEYLPTPKKEIILANLLSRKAKLHALLGPH
jgi:hypothetical protein